MVGRRVILTNRSFTPEELYQFMEEHWNKDRYNSFELGSPTDPNAKLYVMLPATPRYMVIVYSRAAGGPFNRDNKVILSIAHTAAGNSEMLLRGIPTKSVIAGAAKLANIKSNKKEREGPTEEVLQAYTNYMTNLLGYAGYLK